MIWELFEFDEKEPPNFEGHAASVYYLRQKIEVIDQQSCYEELLSDRLPGFFSHLLRQIGILQESYGPFGKPSDITRLHQKAALAVLYLKRYPAHI